MRTLTICLLLAASSGLWAAEANALRAFYRARTGAASTKTFSYRVQPGETLFDIAARFTGDAYRAKEIAKQNGIADPLRLEAGKTIEVPAPALAIRYSIEKLIGADGNVDLETLPAAPTLKRGDRFRVRVAANQEGYLYVFNRDAEGEIRRVFPASARKTARIRRFSEYVLPGADAWFRVDAATGDEELLVLLSLSPLAEFEGELVAAGAKRVDSHFAESRAAASRGITVDDADDDGASTVVDSPVEGTPTLVHKISIHRSGR